MPSPDGPEERQAFYEETYERDIDQIEIDEELADDAIDMDVDA